MDAAQQHQCDEWEQTRHEPCRRTCEYHRAGDPDRDDQHADRRPRQHRFEPADGSTGAKRPFPCLADEEVERHQIDHGEARECTADHVQPETDACHGDTSQCAITQSDVTSGAAPLRISQVRVMSSTSRPPGPAWLSM